MADGRETSQRRDNASGKQLATQDSEDDNDDDEKKGELESSSSPSSSGDSINKDERSFGNKRRSSRHKSDDSSSALSLPNSFDDFTPVTTPAVSPAPSRLRTFDAELKRPPPVRTASSASFNNATNGQRIPDAMRKFYEVQVDKMRKQLAAVLEDKTQTQRVLAAERQKHDDVVAALQQDKDLLTLAEFVQMRVYELIQPHVSAADRAAKDLDVLASRHAECATAIADLERTARIAKQHEDRTARALKDMETERNGLAQQLEAVQAALLEQRRMQSTQAVDDGVNWREKFTSTDIELARTRQCVEVDQLTQKVQLLSGDKAFLMQEKEAAMDKILKLSSALDEATANCRRLELSKETFLEQLEKTREESRHRMEVELAKLQDASRKEMELLRDNGKHLYERENRLLREARMDAQSQVDHLQKKVAELQHAYEDKLAQLGRQFDEKSQQLHQAHLENDMLKQKVDVHKAGFAKLEATTGKQITELQVAVAAEKVVQHEQHLAVLAKQLEQSELEREQLATELATARQTVHHMHQPQQFLEEAVRTLQGQLERVQEAYARQQRETHEQLQAKLALQNQLQQLLSRRHELDTLKNLVLKAQRPSTPPLVETCASNSSPHCQPDQATNTQVNVPKWYLKLRQQQSSATT
ncbi:hypothetical protein DYB32_005345 [Aphanomyces invadans]|uniref:Uncharacterized protein n=1 Tax=Aphanomyces invadans TaxID=157072 RepID=A0A3R6WL38_9STRA|nr:hypothetical protein DYB32_005345 [Aphanomyces invadans]